MINVCYYKNTLTWQNVKNNYIVYLAISPNKKKLESPHPLYIKILTDIGVIQLKKTKIFFMGIGGEIKNLIYYKTYQII